MSRSVESKIGRNGKSNYTPLEAKDILPPREESKPTPVASALALLSSGHSDISALKFLREGHGLSLEQAQAAMELAYEQISSSHKRAPEQKMAVALEQRMKVVAAAMEREDYRTALAAMEQREKLLGLTGPEALTGNQFAATLLQLMEMAMNTGNLTDGAVGGGGGDVH